MKMLKLSCYHDPEQVSSSHLTKDLNKACVQAGITIENYVPTPTRGVSAEVRAKYKKIKYEELENGKIIVHRFSMFREGRNPIQRALRYVLINIVQYYKGIHAKNVDVIYAGSTPPTQGVLCAMVKKRLSKKYKRNVPLIYNLQDVFPDSLVTTGLAKKDSLIFKIGRKIENYTYKNADAIIALGEGVKRNIMEKGVPEEKITVVYNWIDTDATVPVSREENPLFEEFDLSRDHFIVTYAGNLGNSQNVSLLVDCAEALKEKENIRFVIFGSGSEKKKLEKRIAESGLQNIQLLPLQPMEKVSQVYSLGDASFVICKKGVGEGAFPSKAASIMATGTPIIASFDTDSDLCHIIGEENVGLCADAEDVAGAVAAIEKLYNDRALCAQMGENARKLACNRFSKEVGTAARIAVVEQFANRT